MKTAAGKSEVSDAELLSAVAGGDGQALGALYDRFAAILFALVLRIVRGRSEAEDVLQEVFVQIWQRAGDYDATRGRPFLWLSMLARSRALDRVRAIGSRDRAADQAAREPNPEAAADAGAIIADAEEGTLVRRALGAVPEAQREPLLLAYFEGLTQTEIARRTGKPLGTVKTHTRLGLLKLRELLAELRGER